MIFSLQAKQLLRKDCRSYLALVKETGQRELSLKDIPVVKKFSNVFPKVLPRLPPAREIKVSIDLLPGTGPMFKLLYRMASVELKTLKEKLQKLIDKGFIQPNVSL